MPTKTEQNAITKTFRNKKTAKLSQQLYFFQNDFKSGPKIPELSLRNFTEKQKKCFKANARKYLEKLRK